MSTTVRTAANRANAQKSTGPRSAEGKDASRFNALKHGMDAESIIIPGENPAAWLRLAADYNRQFHPSPGSNSSPSIPSSAAHWQKRRLQRTETKIYRALIDEGPTPNDLDVAVLRDSPISKLLHRVIAPDRGARSRVLPRPQRLPLHPARPHRGNRSARRL